MLAELAIALLLAVPAVAAWHIADEWCGDARMAVGYAALAWAAWAIAASELLSIGAPHLVGSERGNLTRGALLGVWLVPAVAGAFVLVRDRTSLVMRVRDARSGVRMLGRGERALLAGIGACGVLTLLVAVVAAPNNWDSQVYHLARVATWARLGGVAHYATNVDPQLYQPPGSELLILQGFVLAGSAQLAALVQWCAYLGSIAVASRAAAALGGARLTQLVAAVLAATTPLAILEASSTQNDLLLGFWLLLAAMLAAHLWTDDALTRRCASIHALAAALAIGMAVLMKGTGLMFGLPVGVLLAAATVRRVGWSRAAALAVAGATLMALPSVGHWSRNHDTYGTLVAAEHAGVDNPYRVQDPGASSLVSNLVRNATNHLDLPIDAWNVGVADAVRGGLDAIGIDADDPRTTFLGQRFRVGPFGPHEDHAGSLLLLVLGSWAAASTIRARWRRAESSGVQLAWLAVIASCVLLFAWFITWQNWHVRLHLPLTLLTAVLVAARLGALRRTRIVWAVCVLALAMAPLYLLANVTRPLVGDGSILAASRIDTLFLPRPQLEAPYREVVERLDDADIRDAGLVTGIDSWQYPLEVLGARVEPAVRFREVLASGPSARYEDADAELPRAVVCVSCADSARDALGARGFAPVPLDAGGERRGRGSDTAVVELWLRTDEAAR